MKQYDAIVVGSGPNGLSAAIEIARAGFSVLVREANESIGGGTRSLELTLPGFLHDACSAIHPMAIASPFFQSLPLADHGLKWIQPSVPLAHPLDNQPSVLLERTMEGTMATLHPDGSAYQRWIGPIVRSWDRLIPEILGPPLHFPSSPIVLANFGLRALLPSATLTRTAFRGARARALFTGLAAHTIVDLHKAGTAAIGLVMVAAAHTGGWPLPQGGSQKIADALASYLRSLGGVIETNSFVDTLDSLPNCRAILLDVTPRQALKIASKRFPVSYRKSLGKFAYGPGIFKVDWALSAPIPWRDPECIRAATLHLGGTAEELEASEKDAWNGKHSERPFVLLAQPSLFDSTRAPEGFHTAWAYCHVPHGSDKDMTAIIEAQVERFAPGFHDVVLARSTKNCAQLERYNANLIGGDIAGGANTLWQLMARPSLSIDPYRTPAGNIYLCSASTPPSGGVHGMCGYHAARSALKHSLGR